MKPYLSSETISFEVFQLKFKAWCAARAIDKENDQLKLLPAFIDDKLLQPVFTKFSLGTTTLKSALSALEEEYLRQTRPPNPEEEFQRLRTTPDSAIDNCERMSRLALYLNLPDEAVKHRLFNSLSVNLQHATMAWLEANSKCCARDLANFVAKFTPESPSTTLSCSATRSVHQDQRCEHCQRRGHPKERCFKLRVCYKCKEKGHIAKFCTKN